MGARLGRPWRLGRRKAWRPQPGLNVLPLAVVQLALVCFFLHLFEPAGECSCRVRLLDRIRPPVVAHGAPLIAEPLILVAPGEVWFDGEVDPAKIEERLATAKLNYSLLHPGEIWNGHVGLQVDGDVAWAEVAPLVAAAGRQGYGIIDVVVVKDPPLPARD